MALHLLEPRSPPPPPQYLAPAGRWKDVVWPSHTSPPHSALGRLREVALTNWPALCSLATDSDTTVSLWQMLFFTRRRLGHPRPQSGENANYFLEEENRKGQHYQRTSLQPGHRAKNICCGIFRQKVTDQIRISKILYPNHVWLQLFNSFTIACSLLRQAKLHLKVCEQVCMLLFLQL